MDKGVRLLYLGKMARSPIDYLRNTCKLIFFFLNKIIIKIKKTMLPDIVDGPSNTLLEVIKENNGKAPSGWKGFRVLTEK